MSDLTKDCEALYKAMKGFGTDEKTIINIIANRSNEYRQKLKVEYQKKYKKDLVEHIKSETSSDFEDVCVALFDTPLDYDVKLLEKAMKGLGTNEDILIEIIASRPNETLKQLPIRYKEMYKKDLIAEIKSEISGDFENIILECLKGTRSGNKNPDDADCEAKANELYEAGEKRLGTDEKVFEKIFSQCSPAELLQIARYYYKITGHTLIQAIEKEFTKDAEDMYKAILYAQINPPEFFAKTINDACKGFGTKDNKLIRTIVSRDEIDMEDIKGYYKKLYKKELIDEIKSECSGNYKKILIEIVDH